VTTVTNQPYTDDDLRREAARQYAEALHNPGLIDVQDGMQGTPIPSTVVDLEPETGEPLEMSRAWHQLSGDGFHDARNEVHELLESAVDLSRWAVDLGACGLRKTTELAWGHGNAWDLAVQIAHRPGVAPELHEAIVSAVQTAVTDALAAQGAPRPLVPRNPAALTTHDQKAARP
jgi:hypothetical protein